MADKILKPLSEFDIKTVIQKTINEAKIDFEVGKKLEELVGRQDSASKLSVEEQADLLFKMCIDSETLAEDEVSDSKLNDFLKSIYPRDGNDHFSVVWDDLFEAYVPENLKVFHNQIWWRKLFDKLIKNWLMPLLQPFTFGFKLTRMSCEIGLGPSLYLINLKFFFFLFIVLTLIGFIPFFSIGGALTFGDYIQNEQAFLEFSNFTQSNDVSLSCGEEDNKFV